MEQCTRFLVKLGQLGARMTYSKHRWIIRVVAAVALASFSPLRATSQGTQMPPPHSTDVEIFGPSAPVAPEVITRDDRGQATVRAVRVTEGHRIDGVLDEEFYETTISMSGFI